MAEERFFASREGERPRHLVEAQELLALALEDALRGLGLEQAPDPDPQLGGVRGLAQDLVGLGRRVA